MAMDETLLAADIWAINGVVLDGEGKPTPPTDPIKAYAKGFIAMLKAGLVMLPLAQGGTGPGAPLSNGLGQGGKIINLLGPVMSGIAGVDPVVAAQVAAEATAIATYMMASAIVSFLPGSVEGQSTETSDSGGSLVQGKGSMGKISGLSGPSMAQVAGGAVGQTGPFIVDQYTVMCNHVMGLAEVSFKPNTITGGAYGSFVGAGVGGTIK